MLNRLATCLKRPDYIPIWILILVIGIVRFACGIFLNNLRGPLGLVAIAICLPLLAIFVIFFVIVIVVSIVLFRRTHSLIPVGILIAGIVVVLLLPLPPPPTTPEEELFLAHRTGFEHVVELARKGELKKAPGTGMGWLPPENYAYVSAAAFMFAYQSDDNGFRVEFVPFETYHPIVYVESLNKEPCVEGIEKKLDDYWYICQVDWN